MSKEKLRRVYDKWSANYDADTEHNIAIIKIHPIVLRLLEEQEDKKVGLDLGCGTGILTIKMSEFSNEVIGIDYSDGMLSEARKKKSLGAKINFIKSDISKKLPFSDSTFDYIISILTLHHIKDLERLYKEVHRILKPGGFFIFDEFVTRPLTKEQMEYHFHVNYPDPLSEAKKKGIKVWRIRDIDEHKELLDKTGFKIDKIIDAYCDKEIEPYIINYKFHEGRVIAKVILARKA